VIVISAGWRSAGRQAATQDRPEEFKLHRLGPLTHGEAEEEFERRRFVNIVALLAILTLVFLGYTKGHSG
jgi:hypothetical protein